MKNFMSRHIDLKRNNNLEEFAKYLLESRMDAIDVDKGFEKICGNRCNWCFCRDVKDNSFHVGRGCPCYAEAILYSLNSK